MKILVPIDFTPVTENALRYAIGLVKDIPHEIVIFHVTETDNQTSAAQKKLDELITRYSTLGIKIVSQVKTGNIFDHIGETAEWLGAGLIIMGTHGIKGMQHIIGSRAMRVITNSKTPYIVVQSKPFEPIKDILVPVDFTPEVKQVLPFLSSFAKQFDATLYLMKEKNKDEFIQKKIDNNLQYFIAFLNDNSVRHNILPKQFASSKYKTVIKEADAINAQLIVTTIDPATGVTDYIMGVDEQKIVANESQIPVLCINIRNFMSKTGNIFEYTF